MNMSVFLSAIEQFHFIRPEWLWSLPIALLVWALLRNQHGDQQWSSHIPKAMLAALKISSAKQSGLWKWGLLLLWLGVIIAAAGPTWDKQAAPIVQNQQALVLVLDLSPSMLAQDLSPDRLTRAKYKLIDVLRRQADGQAALIAYAGDAHTVSPLTDDPRTIEALLPALHPNVMPSRGSNTEAAIELAQQLLADAGLPSGEILLISDGVADDAIESISDSINSNYRLSVLAVGGPDAAPVPAANGGFVRRANGEIVLSAVNSNELRSMASALGGRFSILTTDDSDIDTLLTNDFETDNFDEPNPQEAQQSSVAYDAWVDMGHWLVLLMLPFALVLFRKGVIYLLPFTFSLFFLAPNESYAADFSWKDLWQTRDQQAIKQFESGDFDAAAESFERKDWSALANYKQADYAATINKLSGLEDLTSVYNKANALAFNGQLEEAVEAYEQVLEQQPDHQDAAHNKSVIEQLMQQQNQQQDQESQDSSEDGSEDQQSQEQQQSEDSESQDSESQDSQDQSQQDQQSESEQSNAEKTESEDSDNESEADESEPEKAETDEANAEEANDEDPESEPKNEAVQVGSTDEPLEDASEQWLRTIKDDPSGLLRRKFNYQAQQRAQQGGQRAKDNAAKERY